jgi:hypothetical protein
MERVRTMFALYVFAIVLGIALYATLGILHK